MSPVLGPDVYHGNIDLVPAARIAADPRFGFVILKATEGTRYSWAETWLPPNWKAVGKTRLARGAYHYMLFDQPGKEQAEFYLQSVEAAGGFKDGDLHPIFDAEWKLNDGATAPQVEDCIGDFVDKIHQEGHKVIRYGRSLFRDLGIGTATGADFGWIPRYNDELGPTDDIGFADPHMWQYSNGTFNFTANPSSAPGMGPGDMSVVLTDLERLTVGNVAPVALREAPAAPSARRATPATWTDQDWEALEAHLPRVSDDALRVQEFVLGQLDRRGNRPIPADQGPRRVGWKHEDDLIELRKSLG